MAKKLARVSKGSRFSVPAVLAIVAGLVLFGYFIVRIFAAGPASLYFNPSSGSHNAGTSLAVAIYANTAGQSVNAVQTDFTYPTARLQFTSIDATGSAFGIAASGSGGGGNVSIARGNISPVSGTVLVATVHFNVLSSAGSAPLTWLGSSAVVSSTSNTNILGTSTPASFTVVVPSTPTPTPVPTHTPTPAPGKTPIPTPKSTSSPAAHASTSPTVVAAAGTPTPTPTNTYTPAPTAQPGIYQTPAATPTNPLDSVANAASNLLGGHISVMGVAGAAVPVVLLLLVVIWLVWRRVHGAMADPARNAPAVDFAASGSGHEATQVTGAPPVAGPPPSQTYMPESKSAGAADGNPGGPGQPGQSGR